MYVSSEHRSQCTGEKEEKPRRVAKGGTALDEVLSSFDTVTRQPQWDSACHDTSDPRDNGGITGNVEGHQDFRDNAKTLSFCQEDQSRMTGDADDADDDDDSDDDDTDYVDSDDDGDDDDDDDVDDDRDDDDTQAENLKSRWLLDRSLYDKNGIRLLFAGDNKELTNPIFSEDTKYFLIQEGEARRSSDGAHQRKCNGAG
ncbi:hypothetical protein U0070_000051 [Myodes glareolus]|uniref:Uncharacterized protein n=1 Tax=Myodes glareolus TaxID=447135 RepID=A0AAW0I0Y5_MYOGA